MRYGFFVKYGFSEKRQKMSPMIREGCGKEGNDSQVVNAYEMDGETMEKVDANGKTGNYITNKDSLVGEVRRQDNRETTKEVVDAVKRLRLGFSFFTATLRF